MLTRLYSKTDLILWGAPAPFHKHPKVPAMEFAGSKPVLDLSGPGLLHVSHLAAGIFAALFLCAGEGWAGDGWCPRVGLYTLLETPLTANSKTPSRTASRRRTGGRSGIGAPRFPQRRLFGLLPPRPARLRRGLRPVPHGPGRAAPRSREALAGRPPRPRDTAAPRPAPHLLRPARRLRSRPRTRNPAPRRSVPPRRFRRSSSSSSSRGAAAVATV